MNLRGPSLQVVGELKMIVVASFTTPTWSMRLFKTSIPEQVTLFLSNVLVDISH